MTSGDAETCDPDKLSRRNKCLTQVAAFVGIPAIFLGAFIVPYAANKICLGLYGLGIFDRSDLPLSVRGVFYGVSSAVAVAYVAAAVAVVQYAKRRLGGVRKKGEKGVTH